MINEIVLPFLDYIGAKLESFETGKAAVTLDIENHHVQHLGIVHGGVISTLLDNTGWYAAMTELDDSKTAVTTEIKINYLYPARGKSLRCVGEVIKAGRSSIFVKIELFDEENNDKLISYATGTYAVLEKQ
jgi:uncharacterized protein (TIGR00369 family)